MNLLITKLLHWFLTSGTLFFAAGAVAAPEAAAGGGDAAPAAAPAADPGSSQPGSSQPAAPAAPAAEPSIQDIVRDATKEVEQELTKPAAAPEVKPAAEPAKPAAEPAKPGEPAKPAAEAAKPAAEVNPLDKLGPLPAEKITAALAEAPEQVKAYLQEKGLTVEGLAENARLAAQTSQFLEKVPSLEALDIALEGNANFLKLDAGLPAVKTVEDFDKFMMETLVPMSFILDEKGQPIPDPDQPGAFKNDGSISKLIDFSANVRDSKIGELADMMLKAATSDEAKSYATDLKGAVDFLKQFISNGYKQPGAPGNDPKTLPEWARKEVEDAQRLKNEAQQTQSKNAQDRYEMQESKIVALTDKEIMPTVQAYWDKVGNALSPELKDTITKLAWQQLTDMMEKNSTYTRQRDLLSPATPDYEQRRVAINKQWMQERIVKTLESIVGKLGDSVVDANKTRLDKIDSQSTASRMEPKTSGTQPQSFPATATTDQFHAKAMEMAKAENPNAKEGGAEYWKAVLKLETTA